MYPHGITKPLKNVRKKRFRKTLRKKYVDFPEIEKEVKRLLRTDNDAKSVRYEIVNIEEENKNDIKDKDLSLNNSANNSAYDVGMSNSIKFVNFGLLMLFLGDLFGDVVSSSDDDDDDEASRMSMGFKDFLSDEVDNKLVDQNNKYTFSQILKSESNLATTGNPYYTEMSFF